MNPTSESIRAKKRKLDDAFQTLDDAVGSHEQPPSHKRTATGKSLYSTLAKYGIKVKDTPAEPNDLLSKKTPHLAAILSRAATKKRKVLPNITPPSGLSEAEYRPSSIPSFLSRLSTYKLATYANKPPEIDAVAAAKCGWVNEAKDRLVCNVCNVSWVVAGRDGMTREAANALIEKQRTSLVDMHKNGCPWKSRQCDASIYRIPLKSPALMVKDIQENALRLDNVMDEIEIRHPLTPKQLASFKNAVLSFSLASDRSQESDQSPNSAPSSNQPSETGMLAALFGWSLAPERPRLTSSSRPSLRSTITTPSLSRASSVPPGTEISPTVPISPIALDKAMSRDTLLLHCVLCQRRIGLWAFAPPAPRSDGVNTPTRLPQRRQFDLLQEHRSYCPYVVKSTVVPSLPTAASASSSTSRLFSNPSATLSSSRLNGNDSAVEGWKAILMVVQRYGLGQRLRPGESDDREAAEGDQVQLDGVEAMVEGVKSRGGRDVLQYIRGLLG